MKDQCTCHAFGIYRGLVHDDADPEGLMRLKVLVPQLFGITPTDWAWPCVAVGETVTPALGAPVWVMFIAGDVEKPVWVGTWPTAV